MRQLNVNLDDLAFAFESSFEETHNYFDRQTGEVVVVMDAARRELEALYEELDVEEDKAGELPALSSLLEQQDLPDWQKQAVLEADEIDRGYGTRFIAVPQVDSHEAYGDMEDLITTVKNPHLRELLEVAIMGRGAFRRFKDVLLNYPHERERWFAFRDARMAEQVREWLADHDIEPISGTGGGDD
ncbi:MAG: hypothetical protein AUK03_03435 [Anaerolineae bacterium CG2_30_64_16]|nr:MAG: hypothetical protein AUK03_03435 [Anaerolineae bacterium CG2_30_64_16]